MKALKGSYRNRGVTLMELMVVMVIVGILAAIAIPSYRNHVMRVTRTDAKRDLLAIAGRLERCFTRFNAYNNAGCGVVFPQTTAEGTYQITAVVNALNYTLTATPQAGQADDNECGAFTLNQIGTQGVTGTGTAVACWSGRRG